MHMSLRCTIVEEYSLVKLFFTLNHPYKTVNTSLHEHDPYITYLLLV